MGVILLLIRIIFCVLCMSPWPTFQSSSSDKTYIVLVEEPSSSGAPQLTSLHPEDLIAYYTSSFLSQLATTTTTGSSDQDPPPPSIMYAYRHAVTGFATRLTEAQWKELEKMEGVISVRPESILSLTTTHSPTFLGLNQDINGLWSGSNYGLNQVIGVVDTGITPDHPSFSENGMPNRRAPWNEKPCHLSSCNNKIIGARSFVGGQENAYDEAGHGTHMASIAAGNFVEGANFYGNALGKASGIAPLAQLAIYKVCTPQGCPETAVVAGMEAAIVDGVDVLSISNNGKVVDNLKDDPMAIAAFHAMEKGIFVTFSAGNMGPSLVSVSNGAPWAITVGASTIDREIRATVVLGNNVEFYGQTGFQPEGFTNEQLTLADSLNTPDFTGKMIVVDLNYGNPIQLGQAVKDAGGAAMILVNNWAWGSMTSAEAHVLPAANVGYEDGQGIRDYIIHSKTPVAKIIFGGTVIGGDFDHYPHAPVVGEFSSRGPSPQSPDILKPDIIAPGVNILAAWHTSVDRLDTNKRSPFNIQSGTSQACAHISGVAALLKSAHPDWSPAAIKSAIMTTADVVDNFDGPILDERSLPADLFATGAGHVNPQAASEPGLIYDIQPVEYVSYLCGLGFEEDQVKLFTNIKCTDVKSVLLAQLNSPSFSLTFTGTQANPQMYTRNVTNVGDAQSSYKVTVNSPPYIDVSVTPEELQFSETNQKMEYTVTFSRNASSVGPDSMNVQGFLKLCSSKQCVTSPIAVILYPS